MSEWIVDVKGESGDACFEISVVLADNAHGIKSYGWAGKDKLIVTSSTYDRICSFVWDMAMQTAKDLCEWLNKGHEPVFEKHGQPNKSGFTYK